MRLSGSPGVSNLTLVLVIATVFILLMTGILAYVSLNTRQSALVINTQKTLFEAEGNLFDTVQRLISNPGWPADLIDGPYTDRYFVDDIEIVRTISYIDPESDDDGADEIIRVHVTAITPNASRKLEGFLKIYRATSTPDSPPSPTENYPYATFEDIEFMGTNSFVVEPGDSYVSKRPDSKVNRTFGTWLNETGSPETIPAGSSSQLRWLCKGVCPEFKFYHSQDLDNIEFSTDTVTPGTAIVFGWPVILEDDPFNYSNPSVLDYRRNGIILNNYIVKTCSSSEIDNDCVFEMSDYLSGTDHLDVQPELKVIISPTTTQIIINNDLKKSCSFTASTCIYNDIANNPFYASSKPWYPIIEVKSKPNDTFDIVLQNYPLKVCPDGWLTPPCEYTLKENETGNIKFFVGDSIGLETNFGFPALVPSGESYHKFFYREIDPDPSDFLP